MSDLSDPMSTPQTQPTGRFEALHKETPHREAAAQRSVSSSELLLLAAALLALIAVGAWQFTHWGHNAGRYIELSIEEQQMLASASTTYAASIYALYDLDVTARTSLKRPIEHMKSPVARENFDSGNDVDLSVATEQVLASLTSRVPLSEEGKQSARRDIHSWIKDVATRKSAASRSTRFQTGLTTAQDPTANPLERATFHIGNADLSDVYRVGSGDQISLVTWHSNSVKVRDASPVTLPEFGVISVALLYDEDTQLIDGIHLLTSEEYGKAVNEPPFTNFP